MIVHLRECEKCHRLCVPVAVATKYPDSPIIQAHPTTPNGRWCTVCYALEGAKR